jgi:predicted Ser/Thr protein kinase
MINFTASPRVNTVDPMKKKPVNSNQKTPLQPQATASESLVSAPTHKTPAGLAKVYFGGVNLANAIHKSSEVAQPQALKSEMSLQEYVDTIEEHPLLLRNSAQYALDMINREGVRKKSKYGRAVHEYDFFSNPKNPNIKPLKGNQGSINDVLLHIRAAAKKQDLGKKPIVLMGGPGSGKSTIGDMLQDGYVRYSKTDQGARYATKLINLPEDLRMGEEYIDETLTDPLLYLTPDIRKDIVDSAQHKFDKLKKEAAKAHVEPGMERPNLYDYELGVEGDLTPKAQFIMNHLRDKYLKEMIQEEGLDRSQLEGEKGQAKLVELKRKAYQKVLQNHLKAYRFEYNPNAVPGGIGVFAATDSKTLNTAKINGQVNMVRLMDLPESDPRRFDYVDGAAFRGNRGLLRFKEMHKNPESFYPLLLDLAQAQLIEIESGNAPVHTLIVADSNFPELIEKKGKDVLTAAMKRLDHVFVTHPLELSAEKEIQDGLFKDFEKSNGHVAPHTKEIASLLAIMSRLNLPDDKIPEGNAFLAKKALAYDGQVVDGIEEQEIQQWYEKGQKAEDIEKKEGMDGLSVREMQTIANMVTGDTNVRDLNAVDGYGYLRITRDILEKNRMTLSDDMKEKSLNLLGVAEQYLDNKVKGDVTEVLSGDPEYLNTIFDSYLNNVISEKLGKRVKDPLTNEMVPVDRELMEDIEKKMGISNFTERRQYRDNLAAIAGAMKKEGRQYQLENDPKLKKAILDRAYAKTVDKIDSRVLLAAQHPTRNEKEKLDTIVSRLMAKGYNETTAKNALARVRMLANRDPKILNS